VVNHKDVERWFRALSGFLDERMRRLVAAAESQTMGYGGISAVARVTGVPRRAITKGIKELNARKVRALGAIGPTPNSAEGWRAKESHQ
jgi:hypothetical protein